MNFVTPQKVNKKNEHWKVLGVVFAALYIIFMYKKIRDIYINKDCVYVLGYVYSVTADTDGLDFKFWYKFKGRKYYHGIGSLSIYQQDSLIVLKISNRNPDMWIHLEENLPECILEEPNFDKEWKKFPTCD